VAVIVCATHTRAQERTSIGIFHMINDNETLSADESGTGSIVCVRVRSARISLNVSACACGSWRRKKINIGKKITNKENK